MTESQYSEKSMLQIDLKDTQFYSNPQNGRWVLSQGKNPKTKTDSLKSEPKIHVKSNHRHFIVKVAEACNMACTYCFQPDKAKNKLTREDADLFVSSLKKLKEVDGVTISLEFTGGEPLLAVDSIYYLLAQLKKNEISITSIGLKTNGTVFGSKIEKLLTDFPMHVCLSLDGGALANDKNRIFLNGRGTYQTIVENIPKYKKYSNISNIMVLSEPLQTNDAFELLDNKIVDSLKINPIGHKESGKQKELAKAMLSLIDKVIEKSLRENSLIRLTNIPSFLNTMIYSDKYNSARVCATRSCNAGYTMLGIKANLEVFPCLETAETPSTKLGEISNENSLVEIFAENDKKQLFFNKPLKETNGCKSCPVQIFCKGSCGIRSYHTYGKVGERSDACEYYYELYSGLLERLANPETKSKYLDYLKMHYSAKKQSLLKGTL